MNYEATSFRHYNISLLPSKELCGFACAASITSSTLRFQNTNLACSISETIVVNRTCYAHVSTSSLSDVETGLVPSKNVGASAC
jgi:hypothetical protein